MRSRAARQRVASGSGSVPPCSMRRAPARAESRELDACGAAPEAGSRREARGVDAAWPTSHLAATDSLLCHRWVNVSRLTDQRDRHCAREVCMLLGAWRYAMTGTPAYSRPARDAWPVPPGIWQSVLAMPSCAPRSSPGELSRGFGFQRSTRPPNHSLRVGCMPQMAGMAVSSARRAAPPGASRRAARCSLPSCSRAAAGSRWHAGGVTLGSESLCSSLPRSLRAHRTLTRCPPWPGRHSAAAAPDAYHA